MNVHQTQKIKVGWLLMYRTSTDRASFSRRKIIEWCCDAHRTSIFQHTIFSHLRSTYSLKMSHLSNPQAQRTLKFITAVACTGVGIQAMFFSTYDLEGFEGKEHVFTHLQKDARDFVDTTIYGIDPKTIRQAHQAKQAANAMAASDEDSASGNK